MRVWVVVNPEAGGGTAGRARPYVEALLRKQGVAAEFVESRSTTHVKELGQKAAAGAADVLAVLGGDGTFHHAVNAACRSQLCFAFFPAGNGNDIARGLRIPLDPLEAANGFVRSVRAARLRAIDLAHARMADGSEHVYLAAGGMGLDALAAYLVHGRFKPLPGAVRYVAAALWALREFQPFELEAAMDGGPQVRMGPALFAAVANGPVYGSGACIAPDARMDDGQLELTVVGELPFLRVLEALPIVLASGNLQWPEIRREKGRKLKLRPTAASGRILFHGDGEVLGEAPLEIRVLPGALRIFC